MSKRKRSSPSDDHNFHFSIKIGLFFISAISILWLLYSGVVMAGADRTPPVVSFVIPTNGATIGDGTTRMQSYYIEVSATDEGSGVHRGYLYIDGVYHTGMSGFSSSNPKWYADWNLRGVPNGTHNLEVRAEDYRGNIGSASISITLNNGSKTDVTPPTVTILTPADGEVVKKRSRVSLHWTASDSESGIARVFTYVSGVNGQAPDPKCQDYGSQEGYCTFTAAGVSGEIIVVDTIAWDYEENSAKSTVNLKVQ